MEYVLGYLVSGWLLSGCVLVAFWLLSGCLLFAVAVALIRMLFAVVYVVEYVAEYVVYSLWDIWPAAGCFLVVCSLLWLFCSHECSLLWHM